MEQSALKAVLGNGGNATGGSNNTLQDPTQNWIVNDPTLVGTKLQVLIGGIYYNTLIISNTASQLTFSALPVGVAVIPGTAYFLPLNAAALALILTILSDLAVPVQNSAANILERDVIGNKTDTVAGNSSYSLLLQALAALALTATEAEAVIIANAIAALNNLAQNQILSDATTFPGADIPLAAEAAIVDDHFHNYETVMGKAAAPNPPTHCADVEGLTTFLLTSGANVFGAAVQLLGTSDTPFRAGSTYFDPRKVWCTSLSTTTPYILRIIWGTPSQTVAQAVAAMQYSDTYLQNFLGNLAQQEYWMVRIPAGSQVWAMIKNATVQTANILFSLHEYPSPSP